MNEELLSISQQVGHDEYEMKVVEGGIEIKRNGATHFRELSPVQIFEALHNER